MKQKNYLGVFRRILLLFLMVASVFLFIFLFAEATSVNVSQEFKDEFSENGAVEQFYGDNSQESFNVDRVQLIEEPWKSFETRIKLINSATSQIDFIYHSIDSSNVTDLILAQLLEAAILNPGLKIRIMLDGKKNNDSHIKNNLLALRNHSNVEFYRFNPLGINPTKWNAFLHDKLIIVDNRLALMGGRNIGSRYFDDESYQGEVTYDRDVLLFNSQYQLIDQENSAMVSLKSYANQLFEFSETKSYPIISSEKEQLKAKERTKYLGDQLSQFKQIQTQDQYDYLFTGYKDDQILNEYSSTYMIPTQKVTLICNPITAAKKESTILYQLTKIAENAKKEAIFQSPYLTANRSLLEMFQVVGDNQLDRFELITNSAGSTPNYPAFSNYYSQRNKFLKTDIDIYEYQGTGNVHSKTFMFDGRLTLIGTFNLDDRSFYSSTEAILVIDSLDFYKIVMHEIDVQKDISLQVGKDNEYVYRNNVLERELSFSKRSILWLSSLLSQTFQFLI